MTNHPNRNLSARSRDGTPSPAPDEVHRLRKTMGLSISEAAALVYMNKHAWEAYEAGPNGGRQHAMHPAIWELFRLKARALMGRQVMETLVDNASPPQWFVTIEETGLELHLHAHDGSVVETCVTPQAFREAMRKGGKT